MRKTKFGFCAGLAGAVLVGVAVAGVTGIAPAVALDEPTAEKDALKDCERQICEIVMKKDPSGPDLSCALSKTWAQAKIKDGIEKRRMSWAFGDARCQVEFNAKRDTVLASVTKPEHALELAPHTVKCEIERDKEITAINVALAPKIVFKNGKAEKAWLNVKTIEGPAVVKGAIWTAAQIEDNFGLFHGEIISEINEFLERKCPKAVAGK